MGSRREDGVCCLGGGRGRLDALTPLMIRVPTLVTKPLTLSDRRDDRTRVEPGSWGARRAVHSSRPLLNEARVSWREVRSHDSSRA